MESLKNLDYKALENVLKAQMPKADKRVLPTFQCKSCGNCELNYHNKPQNNIENGFCMKFFQNVDLNEKNVKCWTSKPHTYFEELATLKPKENTKDLHKRNKRASKLNIEFNELTLF